MKPSLHPCMLVPLILTGMPPAEAADLRVPADYATIQAAVDAAASGDTIHIAPGVYVEQTWIHQKNLSLIGQPGTILRAFPGMAPGIPGVNRGKSIVFIGDYSVVTIKDLCFEGDQLGGQNTDVLVGVDFDTAGGSVEKCRFTGFREKTPGPVGGAAIRFWSGDDGATRFPAEVRDTTITDCYTGIRIQGADDVINYDVTLVDNTVTGVGLTKASDPLQGIHTKDGTTGLVARNTISGFAYDGPVGPGLHPIPFGILRVSRNDKPLPPMTFEDNVLRSNQVHLAFFKAADSIVRNNTFEGNFPLIEDAPGQIVQTAAGLWFSGADVQAVGNRFSDLPQGIRLAAQGDDFLGDATDAMLIDNRFCEVNTALFTEPGASYTEQGTLTCPWPDPELDITSAVNLSWPGMDEGFVVESALSVDGPWARVPATPVLRDGRNAVSVATDGAGQYFRLVQP
ncbi:MAG: right-handed parallel beta-helix repeat-containing protein [Verrucomicrobiae bacterium]|nr:right-handed parallel beta-helix repeat-containing protein [Verrucomicrobiae bacterium]